MSNTFSVNKRDEIEFGTLPNKEFELIIITINVTRDSFAILRGLLCLLFELLKLFLDDIMVVVRVSVLTVGSLDNFRCPIGGSTMPRSAFANPLFCY